MLYFTYKQDLNVCFYYISGWVALLDSPPPTSLCSISCEKTIFPLYTQNNLSEETHQHLENNRNTARASSWMHLAALFTALFYLILIWWADILSGRRQTLLLPGIAYSKKTKCCWLIMSPKKLISMIFWIRKNKHKRLTCKNIFYDRKYLKNDNISTMYKNINNIFIYIFIYFIFYTH